MSKDQKIIRTKVGLLALVKLCPLAMPWLVLWGCQSPMSRKT